MSLSIPALPLRPLLDAGMLGSIDLAFAEFIYQQEQCQQARVSMAMLAALVSDKLSEQHTCIELPTIFSQFSPIYQFPALERLRELLQQASTVAVISEGDNGAEQPLVLDNGRLYLQRYWQYEQQIVSILGQKVTQQETIEPERLKDVLNHLFAQATQADSLDWQKVAVAVSARQSFSIITGGPGTGKTTTVTKLMAALQALNRLSAKPPLKIALCAPTGKAAARLTESIASARAKLPHAYQQDLPANCSTIHRLLGALPNRPFFRANAQQPLHLDVLIVDEASMVDLPLMSKLIQALPSSAKLILLGDQQQLSSVEVGSVLSDICEAAKLQNWLPDALAYSQAQTAYLQQLGFSERQHRSLSSSTAIGDSVVKLWQSHRFSDTSGIGQLAKALNQQQYAKAKQLLQSAQWQDIHWHSRYTAKQIVLALMPIYHDYFAAIKEADMSAAFLILQQQILLCARQQGEWGVQNFNTLIEQELHQQGLIPNMGAYYPGKPLMLKRNDHQLGLFNGDVGILLPDVDSGLTKAWFATSEHVFKRVLPHQLPEYDSLYAMTIHKSQGSEFAHVHLCLPSARHNEILTGVTRELFYTGLTRAKQTFHLYTTEPALDMALSNDVKRGSGLVEKLAWLT